MGPDDEDSTHGLPEVWERAVIEKLKQCNLNVGVYRARTIKERILDAMASPNLEVLVKAGMQQQCTGRAEFMSGLCIDERTVQRSVGETVVPHPRSFFGVLYLLLRREVRDFTYPESRKAIEDAVYLSLRVIRTDMYGKTARRPRRDEFILVRQLLRHPRGDCFIKGLPERDIDTAKRELDEILKEVVSAAKARTFGPSLASTSAALEAIRHWALPYGALRFGLPLEFGFILERIDEDPR
jgi:hypothetical protein